MSVKLNDKYLKPFITDEELSDMQKRVDAAHELIESKTGINTMVAEDPMTCVAIGTGKYVEMLSGMRNVE